MPQAVDSVASALEQLSQQLQNLERRVAALECQREVPAGQQSAPVSPPVQRSRPPATWRGFPPLEGSTGAVAILGRAVLGMAGAYLLRALAESSSIPKLPVLLVAILYACFWVVWAVRVHPSSRFASAIYAGTSAMILSPLLWESTVRFQALSPASASFCLSAFVVLAIVLSWRCELQMIPWIATVSSLATALLLIIETRDLAPITAAILTVALSIETAVCLGRRRTLRVLPALAANFAVWLIACLMASPEGIPEGYRPVGSGTITALSAALMTIYGGGIAVRCLVLRCRISFLDILSGLIAFTVGSFGVLRAGRTDSAAGLGIAFLLLAAVCYWAALVRFVRAGNSRNHQVFATWALGLLLAATFLLFPQNWQATVLSLAAVGAAFVYTRTGRLSIGVHASVFLAFAGAISPLLRYVSSALAGTVPSASDWRLWVVGISAALCYGVGSRHEEEETRRRLLWIVPALLLGFAIAGIAISAVVTLGGHRVDSQASILSVVRTVTNCGLALTFGFLGGRLRRAELGWAAYAAVAFGTIKLLFEDLRYGNAASLVVSLLFYGLVLILLPRLSGRAEEIGA